MSKILEALKKLDPANPNHWTEDGSPRMDTIKFMSGDASLTREQVTAAAPGFSRSAPLTDDAPPADPVTPAAAAVTQVASEIDHAGLEGLAGEGETNAQEQPSLPKSDAQALVESTSAALVEASARKAEADQAHAAAVKANDEALDALVKAGGTETLADQLKLYHASQHRALQDRAAKIKALREIPLKDILPSKSRIDEAMARKTARGGQRPKGA